MADESSPAVAATLAAALLGPGMDTKSAVTTYYAMLDALEEVRKQRQRERVKNRGPAPELRVKRSPRDL